MKLTICTLFAVNLAQLLPKIVELLADQKLSLKKKTLRTKGIRIFIGKDSKHSWSLKMDYFRRVDESGLSHLQMFSDISDNDLDNLVIDFMSRHSAITGEPFISGYFCPKKYHIQWSRVRASINRVESSNAALRWGALVRWRRYYVP